MRHAAKSGRPKKDSKPVVKKRRAAAQKRGKSGKATGTDARKVTAAHGKSHAPSSASAKAAGVNVAVQSPTVAAVPADLRPTLRIVDEDEEYMGPAMSADTDTDVVTPGDDE